LETLNVETDIEGGGDGSDDKVQKAWNILHGYLGDRSPNTLFREEIDRHGMIDLDLHLFEEGLQSLMEESGGNLSLADDDIYLLWDDALAMSPTMAPEEENPLINAEDFEAAMGMHPPS